MFVGTAIVFAFIGWLASLATLMSSASSVPQLCNKTSLPCTVNASTSYLAWSSVDHDTTVLGSGVTQIIFSATGNNSFTSTGIKFNDAGITCTPKDPKTFTCTVPSSGSYKYTVTLKGTFSVDPWVVNN
jgi:hypothetical protein